MKTISVEKAMCALQRITGCDFRFGIKSTDMDLYQLGFGEDVVFVNYFGNLQKTYKYAIHFTCELHLKWSDNRKTVYHSKTDAKAFCVDIEPLIGLPVKHVELFENNNLLIDLDVCKLEIAVRKDADESWRFFLPGQNEDHIVACSKIISVQ